MPTVTDLIREHLLQDVITAPVGDKTESLDYLTKSEWVPEFEKAQRQRLLVGRFRYGPMQRKVDTNYDRIGSAKNRIEKYVETGNLEFLVDASNLLMCEFKHGKHPNRHFDSIDDGEHCNKL